MHDLPLFPIVLATLALIVSGSRSEAQVPFQVGTERGPFVHTLVSEGDTLALTHWFRSSTNPSGVVLVKRRVAPYRWVDVTTLNPTSGTPLEETSYGYSIDTDGATLAIGAPTDGQAAAGSGLVYVHERDQDGPNAWGLVTLLASPAPRADERFGEAVAVFGDLLAVGTSCGDSSAGNGTGAVHLYVRPGGPGTLWLFDRTLAPPAGSDTRAFGRTLELDADTLVVAGLADPDRPHGRVDLFERSGGSLNPSASHARPGIGPAFGSSLSLFQSLLAVGAPSSTEDPSSPGAVLVFDRRVSNPGTAEPWAEVATIIPATGVPGSLFGWHVELEGAELWVGAPQWPSPAYPNHPFGGLWSFTSSGANGWLETSFIGGSLEAREYGRGAAFTRVDTALLSTPVWPTSGLFSSGADVFRLDLAAVAGSPTFALGKASDDRPRLPQTPFPAVRKVAPALSRKLVDALDPVALARQELGPSFARSIAATDDVVVVCSGQASEGAVVYELVSEEWTQVARLIPADASSPLVFGFGASVATDGNTVVIGANGRQRTNSFDGAAYVFERDLGGPDAWGEATKLQAGALEGKRFGSDVAVDGTSVAISARWALGREGAVVCYERTQLGVWSLDATLLNPSSEVTWSEFGEGLVLEGNTLAATASRSQAPHGARLVIFERSAPGALWSDAARFENLGESRAFFSELALDGDRLAWVHAKGRAPIYESTIGVYQRPPQEDWFLAEAVDPPPGVTQHLGPGLDLRGDLILVALNGANPNFSNLRGPERALLYGFDDVESQWNLDSELFAPDWLFYDAFANGVALVGNALFVTSPGDDDLGADSGSVYLFDEAAARELHRDSDRKGFVRATH